MTNPKSIKKCPCCQQSRHITECRIFSEQLRHLIRNYPSKIQSSKGEMLGNYYWDSRQSDSMDWACDECLQNGKAIKGDPTKQLFCHAPPHFAYFDKEKECRVCKETFVFTKSEQQYWYDHLSFWVQATRVYCPKCQSTKKQKDRISQLLNDFSYLDIEKLKEVVELYIAQGNYKKAKYHLTHAKKLRQRDSLEYINLDSWINEIKQIEKEAQPNEIPFIK